ncbi:hypothetical protein [Streptomyces sp. YS-3]|uniref:hypothetical protein n=1 Tax=Streptomyces sp. YS-3 TaxID=3381352 RepID=UPI00386257DD
MVDDVGTLVAKWHITDDAADYKILLELLTEYGDTQENPIWVAIETSRTWLCTSIEAPARQVEALVKTGVSA